MSTDRRLYADLGLYDALAARKRPNRARSYARWVIRHRGIRHRAFFERRHALEVLAVIHQGHRS